MIRPRWMTTTIAALIAVAGLCAIGPATREASASAVSAPPVVDPSIQPPSGIQPADLTAQGTSEHTGAGITPLFAPVPFRDSQLGWGLAVLAGVIHRFDSDTTLKPSTGALGGFYSENKSWGVMALEMARLRGDSWRVRGLVAHMEIFYDFYGVGEDAGNAGKSIALDQPMDFAVGSALRRIMPGLYGGANVLWIRSRIALEKDHGLPTPPAAQDLATMNLAAPGIQAEFDTRDDDYWPRHGSLAALKGNFFTGALGSARDFERYAGAWSWYTELRARELVLATNLNLLAATGDAPFWAIPSVGGGAYGLRGYTQGRYRDHVVTTAQAELRAHTAGRWGATAFGGFANVAPSVGDLGGSSALPAGGAGLRFQLTRQYPMHMRADFAWGKNERIFYFSVAEAF